MAAVAVALASACFFAWDSLRACCVQPSGDCCELGAPCRNLPPNVVELAARCGKILFTAAEAESGGEAAVAVVTGFVGALWALASACFTLGVAQLRRIQPCGERRELEP